ncbi:MAG: hypothetical protein ABIH46_11260 [Chloroflexota bacterium]
MQEPREERAMATTASSGIVRILRPVVSVQEAVQAWNEYQELCKALLTEEDYQPIQGKRFKKKSAWRKLGNVFALSVVPLEKSILRADPEDPTSQVAYAEFTVQATAPNGRTMAGWGACSVHEERGFTKPDHDIPATAMTRAVNRAISDLIGAGEVSAEEMAGEERLAEQSQRSIARTVAGGPLATPAQVGAIYAIGRQNRGMAEEQIEDICREQFGGRRPSELSKKEASGFIETLKSEKPLASSTPKPSTPAPTAPTEAPKPKPIPNKPDMDDWTPFWAETKRLGYKDANAVHAGLGVKSVEEWIKAGGTKESALEMLRKLAGVPAEGGD